MFQGIVLDAWRDGGALFWARTTADPAYRWQPRAEVFRQKRARRAARERAPI